MNKNEINRGKHFFFWIKWPKNKTSAKMSADECVWDYNLCINFELYLIVKHLYLILCMFMMSKDLQSLCKADEWIKMWRTAQILCNNLDEIMLMNVFWIIIFVLSIHLQQEKNNFLFSKRFRFNASCLPSEMLFSAI